MKYVSSVFDEFSGGFAQLKDANVLIYFPHGLGENVLIPSSSSSNAPIFFRENVAKP